MASDAWDDDSSSNWDDKTDWTAGVPGSTSNVAVNKGDPEVTAAISIASLNDSAQVNFFNAGSSNISGAVANSGWLGLDADGGNGGSSLTIGGGLTNSGTLSIGNADLSAATTVTAASLTNFVGATLGTIDITGDTNIVDTSPSSATLIIDDAAGFGETGDLVGSINLSGNAYGHALLEFKSGEITTIGGGSELTLNGPDAYVADASNTSANSALASLATIAGSLSLEDGESLSTNNALKVSGSFSLDGNSENGGSNLTIGGNLTNTGTLNIGNGYLSKATILTVASLTDFVGTTLGTINVTGDINNENASPISATLSIESAAGLGTPSALIGSVNLNGDGNGHALLEFTSGEITTIVASSELTLNGPDAFVADASNTSANSALTSLATIAGGLNLQDNAVSINNALTNTGSISLDANSENGGSRLTIVGTLTNTGTVNIGNGYLSAATNVSVASVIDFIGTVLGTINITGDYYNKNTSPNTATLDIGSAAGLGTPNDLIGSVNLLGDAYGHALLQFVSGEITNIGVNSELTLDGPDAFVADASNTSANSALTSLATIAGALSLENGASISTDNPLSNSGGVYLDNDATNGGSSLTIGGGLTNSGTLTVGNSELSAAATVTTTSLTDFVKSTLGTINIAGDTSISDAIPISATLDVGSAASFGTTGNLIGSVNIAGNAYGRGLLQFASGEITTITANSELTLNGPDAFIADAFNILANSALTSLATNSGNLTLANGASVSTNNALISSGGIFVDNNSSNGGSSLTIGGALTSSGTLTIGNSELNAATTVTTTSLVNFISSTLGTINISGDTYSSAPLPLDATLDILGAASFGIVSTLKGSVNISGNADGSGVLEFVSGEITSIAANSELTLNGPDAFLADASNTSANGALTSLATISGSLTLENRASVSTNNALTSSGGIFVDNGSENGGANLTIGGALTSSGTLSIGNGDLTAATAVTAASLANLIGSTLGTINISGDTSTSAPIPLTATLDIFGAAGFGTASTLEGSVNINGNAYGSGVLEFGSGEITTIAAASELTLNGPDAFLADASNSSANSALISLATISGSLTLDNGASVSTNNALMNSGSIYVDTNAYNGGSDLTIGGGLTNDDHIDLGNSDLASGATLSADELNNSGTINIAGSATSTALLSVSGTATNTGAIDIGAGGVASITGAVTGVGAVNISNGGLLSLSETDKGGTISFGSGGGQLDIADGARVSTIQNFSIDDMIDLDSYEASYQAVFYASASGGTLEIVNTVDDAIVAAIHFSNSFSGETFALTQGDSGDTEIGLANAPWANPQPGDVLITAPAASGYSAYQYDYSTGGDFIGSQFYYTNITGEPYTTQEVDYNGAGQATRVAFSGVTGEPFSSYEYDYVAGVFSGSKFDYTTVPQGASYSSYDVDYNQNGFFSGEQFNFTAVTGEPYTGEVVAYDGSVKLSSVLLTGVQDQAYTSLQYDYSAGTYEGYQAYYTVTGQAYTTEEVDVSASGQLEKVIYSGMTSTPYSSVEQDYANGALNDQIYNYTDVTGQTYYAYELMENASGASLQETFDLDTGGHNETALATGQTLTSLGEDRMTGDGATTFVFNAVYGADVIANFTIGDTVSLPTSEFANFAAMKSAATQSGANVLITATSDGDTLTLKNLTTATLAGLSSDFMFHG